LYQRRFRPEFMPAFQTWLAGDPLNNPDAESSPWREPQYRVANLERSMELDKQGDEHFDEAKEATEHTDNYVLTTVFFATVLFFAGISMRFVWQRMRIAVLVLGTIFLAYAIVLVARLPILSRRYAAPGGDDGSADRRRRSRSLRRRQGGAFDGLELRGRLARHRGGDARARGRHLRRPAHDLQPVRRSGPPSRVAPRAGGRARAGRQGGHRPRQLPRVPRDVLRRAEARLRAGQRELPLPRRRGALHRRQLRRQGRRARPRVRRHGEEGPEAHPEALAAVHVADR